MLDEFWQYMHHVITTKVKMENVSAAPESSVITFSTQNPLHLKAINILISTICR